MKFHQLSSLHENTSVGIHVSISSMFYEQLLALQITKAQKKTDNLTVFFWLSGSVNVKSYSYNVYEIDHGCQFHQHFMCSYCAQRSKKHKKSVKPSVYFSTFGICLHKSCSKHFNKIDPKCS